MRSATLLVLLASLGGCSASDPAWSKPCSEQPPATLEVGSGEAAYLPIGTAGIPIEIDTTGTYVWLGVSTTGLGPDVTVSTGLKDASGKAIASLMSDAVSLSYDEGTNRDEAWGLAAQFVAPSVVDQLIGTTVTVWGTAEGCGYTAKGSATTTLSGYDTAICQGCLAEACLPEVQVCGAECVDIQACLDTYCVNLSANASPDEVTCQAYCQALNPSGKQAHIALVNCVQASACQPPCNGYSIDYDACVAAVNTMSCATQYAKCNGDADCQAYKTCTASCTTWTACEACGTSHPKGVMLYQMYEACVEATCLTLGWLPHLSE